MADLMIASKLIEALRAAIEQHGDLVVTGYAGEPSWQGRVSRVDFVENSGMDGDMPNPHFTIEVV